MCRKGEKVCFGPVRFTHGIETLSSPVCSSHRQGEVSYSIPTDADRSGVSRLFPPFATSIPIFLSRRSFKDDFISSQPPRHLIKCLLKREPEASAAVETLTSFLFIRNSPPGQNPSRTERLGERIGECLWTDQEHVRAQTHMLGEPHTCMQTCLVHICGNPSTLTVVRAVLASSGRNKGVRLYRGR